jgi:hypothetical protein
MTRCVAIINIFMDASFRIIGKYFMARVLVLKSSNYCDYSAHPKNINHINSLFNNPIIVGLIIGNKPL